jgi:hypothetical protein
MAESCPVLPSSAHHCPPLPCTAQQAQHSQLCLNLPGAGLSVGCVEGEVAVVFFWSAFNKFMLSAGISGVPCTAWLCACMQYPALTWSSSNFAIVHTLITPRSRLCAAAMPDAGTSCCSRTPCCSPRSGKSSWRARTVLPKRGTCRHAAHLLSALVHQCKPCQSAMQLHG